MIQRAAGKRLAPSPEAVMQTAPEKRAPADPGVE